MAADVNAEVDTPSTRRPSLNFSYPRLSRHESSESRSSNGSVPGMTDASDSDASFDDDGCYNTSACQLWDSFWPDNATSCIHQPSQDQPRSLPQSEHDPKVKELATPHHTSQSPPISEPEHRKSSVTYSVYHNIPAISVERHPHPPRTSSLSFTPPSPPRRSLCSRGSRPSVPLKPTKSSQNIRSVFIAPIVTAQGGAASPQSISQTKIESPAVPFPESPAYPPPPPPKTLRASTSAFSIRDKARALNSGNNASTDNNGGRLVAYNVTPPLPPLLPSPLPEPRSLSPEPERFVSVFDFDSDSESEDESNSFARRIARGLHRKSASEKRSASWRKPSNTPTHRASDAAASKYSGDKQRNSGSLSSRRGGSLGRIFGLMGR